MAATRIWPINGDVFNVLEYVGNKEKTANENYTELDIQGLKDVMDYAVNPDKTDRQYFVSGINCIPATARQEMILTKKRFNKITGRTAYHAYQSFDVGEATPQQAHEIGIKLAQELWGDKFQVVVATHCNTKCTHNHFVLNSVSFIDGKKFHSDCKSYFGKMRVVSDRICIEHGLSYIANPQIRKRKHYSEILADRENKPTWRGTIRADFDIAIKTSMTMSAFIRNLHNMGYEVKTGVHIAVRPPNKERFVRLESLGEGYTEETIKSKILCQNRPEKPPYYPPSIVKKAKVYGDFKLSKITLKSLQALYFHYRHQLRKAQAQPHNPEVVFLLREDLRYLDEINRHTVFLFKHKIETREQLLDFRSEDRSEMRTAKRILERSVYLEQKREQINEVKDLRNEMTHDKSTAKRRDAERDKH